MWGTEADRRDFGALWPLWFADDHSARDRKQAVKHLRALSDRDYAPGQCGLGMAHFDGAGVRRDYHLSFRHFLAAAERGYPTAECMIGNFYVATSSRYDVCEEDPAQGVQWWRRAAESGNSSAQFNLATACSTGNGLDKNDLEAYVWAGLAAHCSPIRLRPAEVLRDRVAAELGATHRADGDARIAELKARLPLPWSEHLVYWMSLAREAGIPGVSGKVE